MTLDEAKTDLNTIYKTLRRERAMREKVGCPGIMKRGKEKLVGARGEANPTQR